MIPKFKYFNKPFLEALSDGRAARKSDIVPIVATKLKLTKEDMKLETPGGQNVLYDRISWTCVYLRKAGMVSRPRKGLYQITELGIKALNDGNEVLDNKTLGTYSEAFSKFQYIAGSTDWKEWTKLKKNLKERTTDADRQE